MTEFNRFDIVQILTTRNVSWISSYIPDILSPEGLWSVVQQYEGNDLLICKGQDLVRIPPADVKKIGNYSLETALTALDKVAEYVGRRSNDGKRRQEEATQEAQP